MKQQLGFLELSIGIGLVFLASVNAAGAMLAFAATLFTLGRAGWAVYAPPGANDSRALHSSLFVFFLSAVMGAGTAYDPALSWPLLTALAGSVLLFYAMFDLSFRIKHRVTAFLVVVLLLDLYFILLYISFDYTAKSALIHKLGLLTGPLNIENLGWIHRNTIAAILEGAFLLTLGMAAYQKQRRWIWLIVLGVIGYGLLITVSRGAWLAVAGMALVWFVLRLSDSRHKLIGAGAILMLIVAGGFIVAARPNWVFGNDLLSNDSGRSELFGNAIYLLKDFWLTGIGLGQTFAMVYSKYVLLIGVPFLTYSHNLFLQVALGQGLLGLVSFITLLLSFYWAVLCNRPNIRKSQLPLFDGAWLGLTATLLHGLVDASQLVDFISLPPLLILMAFTLSFRWKREARWNNVAGAKSKFSPYTLAAIAGAVTLFLIAGGIWRRPLSARVYANWGALSQVEAELSPNWSDAQRQLKHAEAVRYFEQSLDYDATNSAANRWMGLFALEDGAYQRSIDYLETAYVSELNNFTLWKSLGYAHLWQGNTTEAQTFLAAVPEAGQELGYWTWWWDTRNEAALSERAAQMKQALEQVGR